MNDSDALQSFLHRYDQLMKEKNQRPGRDTFTAEFQVLLTGNSFFKFLLFGVENENNKFSVLLSSLFKNILVVKIACWLEAIFVQLHFCLFYIISPQTMPMNNGHDYVACHFCQIL